MCFMSGSALSRLLVPCIPLFLFLFIFIYLLTVKKKKKKRKDLCACAVFSAPATAWVRGYRLGIV